MTPYEKASARFPAAGRFKNYLLLAKPGIVFGNLASACGGMMLASPGGLPPAFLLLALAGIAGVIACGCVLNNYIDRDIDGTMRRTRGRVLVKGLVAPAAALRYAWVLGGSGLALLYTQATPLSAFCAAIGLTIYVVAYSLYFKRNSVHGTLIGSLAGAMPPVIGYTAVAGAIDLAALLLFTMFSLWQLPHAYAIAIFRRDDHLQAGLPVLPLVRGLGAAKRRIAFCILLFTVTAALLSLCRYTGGLYLALVMLLGGGWLCFALAGFFLRDSQRWGRGIFLFSLVIAIAVSVLMAVDRRDVSAAGTQETPGGSVSAGGKTTAEELRAAVEEKPMLF